MARISVVSFVGCLLLCVSAWATSPAEQPTAQRPGDPVDTEEEWLQLLREADVDTRRRAIRGLTASRSSGFEYLRAPLMLALRDPDIHVRMSAVIALVHNNIRADDELKATVPWLIEALEDPDRRVRTHAMSALGALGEVAAPAVPALARALAGDDEEVWDDSAKGLAGIGPPAVPALTDALQGADKAKRLRVIEALAKRNRQEAPAAVPALAALVGPDGDPEVVLAATYAITEIDHEALPNVPGAAAALPLYLKALRGDDQKRADQALMALASLGPAAASAIKDMLVYYRKNPDRGGEYGRGLAVGSGIRLMGDAAVPELRRLLETDPDPWVRANAASALPAAPWQDSPAQRPANDARNRHVIPALLDATGDPDAQVRAGAVSALGIAGCSDAVPVLPALAAAQGDADPRVRAAAVKAYGTLSRHVFPIPPEVTAGLRRALEDEHPKIRESAAGSLKSLREREELAKRTAEAEAVVKRREAENKQGRQK